MTRFLPLIVLGLTLWAVYATAQTEQVTEQVPVAAEEQPAVSPAADSTAKQTAGQPEPTSVAPASVKTTQEADISPLIKTVKLNFKEGRFEAADQAVDLALKLRPDDYVAVKLKAMIALKLGKMDIAEQNFNLALTVDTSDAELDFYLGGFYGKKGDFISAENRFLKYARYNMIEPYRERLRKYSEYVKPKADRARARLLLQQEASLTAAQPATGTVAVVSFANTGAHKELDPLQKGLAEMMITDLSQVGRFKVIERVQMQALVDEMALGQTGLLEESNSDRLGKLLAAEKVISGSFASEDGKNLSLGASLSFSSTAGVVPIGSLNGSLADLFKLEKDLVFKVIKEMGIILTDAERKKIEVIPTENVLAFLAYSKGLDAEDRGDFSSAAANYSEALRLDPGFSSARSARDHSVDVSETNKPGSDNVGKSGGSTTSSGLNGAGEITTPVFTVNGLDFSATGSMSLHTLNAVNVSFMPEKPVVAATQMQTPLLMNPVTNPVKNSEVPNENHGYLESYNVGFGSGATTIKARVPIPDVP